MSQTQHIILSLSLYLAHTEPVLIKIRMDKNLRLPKKPLPGKQKQRIIVIIVIKQQQQKCINTIQLIKASQEEKKRSRTDRIFWWMINWVNKLQNILNSDKIVDIFRVHSL